MNFNSCRFDNYQPLASKEYSTRDCCTEKTIYTAIYEGEVGLVYSIECTETWTSYVGITSCHFKCQKNVSGGFTRLSRLATHERALRRGVHPSRQMQQDWNKWGENAFLCTCLEVIPLFSSGSATLVCGGKETLRRLEARWHNVLGDTYSKPNWNKKNNKRSQHHSSQIFIECLGLEIDFSYAPIEETAS